MKGYRTFALAAATLLLGLIGKHVAPDLLNEYLDVTFAGISVGIVALRMVTNTPFGSAVAADLGTTPSAIQAALQAIDPDAPANLSAAVSDLNVAIDKLSGHPLLQSGTTDALTELTENIPSLITALSSATAAPVAAVSDPASGTGAPQPAPQPQPPSPTPAPAASPSPAAPQPVSATPA